MGQGKANDELSAVTGNPIRLGRDGAAVRFGNFLDDQQSQAGAADAAHSLPRHPVLLGEE